MPDNPSRQAKLDFSETRPARDQAPATNDVTPSTQEVQRTGIAVVVRLADHHRARHFELVRKLIAEAGVFRAR
jgi:hypothetical protein